VKLAWRRWLDFRLNFFNLFKLLENLIEFAIMLLFCNFTLGNLECTVLTLQLDSIGLVNLPLSFNNLHIFAQLALVQDVELISKLVINFLESTILTILGTLQSELAIAVISNACDFTLEDADRVEFHVFLVAILNKVTRPQVSLVYF